MEKPEERNEVEEREADPDSMFLVPLDASTPTPFEEGLAMVAVESRSLFYGIPPNHHWLENIKRAELADQAYRDREAARKRALAGTRRETLKHVAVGAVVGALIEAGVFVALRLAGIL